MSTPLCRFYALNGSCRYGDNCLYSHEIPECGIIEARKQIPCQFFARGNCRYGDQCCFSHQEVSSQEEGEPLTCGVCLEDVVKVGHKFGLLSCCTHCFCFECLMNWRVEGSQEAEDRRCCPTCRKPSNYVVPSTRYAVGEEKEQIVKRFKQKLAGIPCKHFNGALGSCPFGRDCFYAHHGIDGEDLKPKDLSIKELHDRQLARKLQRRQNFNDFMFLLYLRDLMSSHPRDFLWDDSDDDFDDYF